MPDWYGSSEDSKKADVVTEDELPFQSRRSPVLCRNGCVASSQPLASTIGLSILQNGGNAADASIATAAALAVLEPCSTGLGGDMFALLYENKTKSVKAINGSGRCPEELTIDFLLQWIEENRGSKSIDEAFMSCVHAITIPGAAGGWNDMHRIYGSGKFSLSQLLEPAAKLAEEGFPVAPVTARYWQSAFYQIKRWETNKVNNELSINGNAPKAGEIFRNPGLARVLRDLGEHGAKKGFYEGFAGKQIVAAMKENGGFMTESDLASHSSTYPEPISVEYKGKKLWQVPPNGQGIAGLIALSSFAALEKSGKVNIISDEKSFCDGPCLHALIEMMRLGFADARSFVADEESMNVTKEWMLDTVRIQERAFELFDPTKAVIHGLPDNLSGTVSFQVVDKDGNAVSFVNSNFQGFGNGIIPSGCGFSLQNRGFGFSLDPTHPNCLHPKKRPYHTIIPGMITHADDTNDLYASISNMGGFMQPQGHLQLTIAMVACGLDPQRAIDLPRFCIADGTKQGTVFIEEGLNSEALDYLKSRGHKLKGGISGFDRSVFGKAQIIYRDRDSFVLWAGSDGRGDGCAMGF